LLDLLPSLHPILSRGNSPELEEFLNLLHKMLQPPAERERMIFLRKADPVVQKALVPWLESLREVYQETGLGARVLWRFGQPVSPEDEKLFSASNPFKLLRLLDERLEGKPLLSELSADRIRALRDQIAQKGRLPSRLLGELFFEQNKQWVFLHSMNFELLKMLKEGAGIMRDLNDLAEQAGERPVVLALLLPRGLQGEFEAALRDPDSEMSRPLQEGIYYLNNGREILEARPLVEEMLRETAGALFKQSVPALLSLQRRVHLEAFGPDIEKVTGENAFDQMLSNLMEISRIRPSARVVVYGPLEGPPFSKVDFRNPEELQTGRSLAAAFGERIGPERVASVIEETEAHWEAANEPPDRIHNLIELAGSVPTSFAVHLGDFPELHDIRFSEDWLETYSPQVWDALIFRREDDGEDPDFFTPPEAQKPEALEPNAGPRKAAVVSAPTSPAAGAEDQNPEWQPHPGPWFGVLRTERSGRALDAKTLGSVVRDFGEIKPAQVVERIRKIEGRDRVQVVAVVVAPEEVPDLEAAVRSLPWRVAIYPGEAGNLESKLVALTHTRTEWVARSEESSPVYDEVSAILNLKNAGVAPRRAHLPPEKWVELERFAGAYWKLRAVGFRRISWFRKDLEHIRSIFGETDRLRERYQAGERTAETRQGFPRELQSCLPDRAQERREVG
jgi:hypothetical protein